MHTKLTIPERLKDLRVSEKRMSLQELSDATGIPSSTLGNYEKDENIYCGVYGMQYVYDASKSQ